jgi:hypothetical protein
VADPWGYPRVTARAERLVYATMTGTDVALYRLDRTYERLASQGAKTFELGTTPVRPGDEVTMVSPGTRSDCSVKAVPAHLREGGYRQDDPIRPDAFGAATGSPCAAPARPTASSWFTAPGCRPRTPPTT